MQRVRAAPGTERGRGGVHSGGGGGWHLAVRKAQLLSRFCHICSRTAKQRVPQGLVPQVLRGVSASAPLGCAEREDEGGAGAKNAEEEEWASAGERRARRGGRGAVGDREAADDVGVAEAGGAVEQHEHPDLYVPRALSEQQRWPA
ncbi:hypothetical protein FGB62_18g34 [Gracilaria domingensis]|nr:hypothetical protein FGB62_18g34 [Gracilaria domingensis]